MRPVTLTSKLCAHSKLAHNSPGFLTLFFSATTVRQPRRGRPVLEGCRIVPTPVPARVRGHHPGLAVFELEANPILLANNVPLLRFHSVTQDVRVRCETRTRCAESEELSIPCAVFSQWSTDPSHTIWRCLQEGSQSR